MSNSTSHNFVEWNRTMYAFYEDMHSSEAHEHDNPTSNKISKKVHEIFLAILFQFIQDHKFKDEWKYIVEPHVFAFGQSATITSEKLGTSFDFGTYMNEFFLSCHLSSPLHLRSMNDDFWRLVIELPSFAKFEFSENAVPQTKKGSEEERLMGKGKGTLVTLST